MKISQKLARKFWRLVDKSGDCWEWQSYKTWFGHGRFMVNGHCRAAHRVSYTIMIGPIPKGKVLLHLCDNPGCVNPAHLRVGTQGENIRDAAGKGRLRNRGKKLNPPQVRKIRNLYRKGVYNQTELAKIFDLTVNSVCNIVNRKTWANVR
jgi:hypothetical protein